MRVTILGSGAADGWPQPFCHCASCEYAREHSVVRARSGVLVDDTVLIDPSPDTTTSVARGRLTLDRVSTILIGHAHPDHVDPSLLLSRHWIDQRHGLGKLDVYAPQSALDLIEPWLDPAALSSGTITLHPVVIGAEIELASGHRVTALPAEHSIGFDANDPAAVEAVLWQVRSADNQVLLYAADTGPIKPSTFDLMHPADLVLIEETFGDVTDHDTAHLDLATFPGQIATMRERGIITEHSEVVAIHLSHFNPREPELMRRLGAWGVRAGRDLDVFDLGTLEPIARRPRRILVTGGARSGKSREAERIVASEIEGNVTYVATAPAMVNDPEWDDRVARHQARRPQRWTTRETSDIAAVIQSARADESVLIDCLTLWLTAVIDDCDGWQSPDRARTVVVDHINHVASALASTSATIVLVTNEVGSGIVPDNAGARMFRDLLGEVNSRVSAQCDDVRLVVAGHTISLSE